MTTVVLYPSPGIGHLISMVELGKSLLSHSKFLNSVTILIPAFPLPPGKTIPSYISSVSSSFPSITFHSLPPISLLRGLPSSYPDVEIIIYESLRSNSPNVLDALRSISSSYRVAAFVLDFFCYPALDHSKSLNIPTYFFFTSGACALAFFLNFPAFDKLAAGNSYRNLNMSFEIPGLFEVPSSQMLEPMLDRGESYEEFVKVGAYLTHADGIIVNTFDALEGRAVKALKDGTCLRGTTVLAVYCIGPLIADRGEKVGDRHECLGWLDLQPHRSVVYLAFGSLGLFSKDQIGEIARGLERSGVRFLWVVRAPPREGNAPMFELPPEPDFSSILPQGFIERTRGRGLVVKSWAPQTAVLAHQSVGAFVTHCGWNSTLEAVCAGVPMVAWPLYAEQRFNKIVLVQELGIALPINESEDRFVSSDEIEKRVKQIMDLEESDALRKRMQTLEDEAKLALSEEGSSTTTLSRLVGLLEI